MNTQINILLIGPVDATSFYKYILKLWIYARTFNSLFKGQPACVPICSASCREINRTYICVVYVRLFMHPLVLQAVTLLHPAAIIEGTQPLSGEC